MRRWACALWLLMGLAPGLAPAGAPPKALTLTDCAAGAYVARCGTFVVYEDRAAHAGRTLALPLVILPARHPGGRGASAVEFAALIAEGAFARELRQLRETYDIVLVDNRGIGGAGAQACELSPPAHPEYYFLQLWPDEPLRACRARLAA